MMIQSDPNRDPVIVASARTAIGKARRGSLATVRPDDMAAAVIRDLLLLSLGFMGEYVSRIYDEVKDRPLYLVADVYGLEQRAPGRQGAEPQERPARQARIAHTGQPSTP